MNSRPRWYHCAEQLRDQTCCDPVRMLSETSRRWSKRYSAERLREDIQETYPMFGLGKKPQAVEGARDFEETCARRYVIVLGKWQSSTPIDTTSLDVRRLLGSLRTWQERVDGMSTRHLASCLERMRMKIAKLCWQDSLLGKVHILGRRL